MAIVPKSGVVLESYQVILSRSLRKRGLTFRLSGMLIRFSESSGDKV